MSKVAVTYWDNQAVLIPAAKTRARGVKQRDKIAPQWFVFAVMTSMALMLCLTINLRAYSELNAEIGQNQKLSIEVDQMTDANLALQDEIHNLKTDPQTVEREARKLGMGRVGEKILVPAN